MLCYACYWEKPMNWTFSENITVQLHNLTSASSRKVGCVDKLSVFVLLDWLTDTSTCKYLYFIIKHVIIKNDNKQINKIKFV